MKKNTSVTTTACRFERVVRPRRAMGGLLHVLNGPVDSVEVSRTIIDPEFCWLAGGNIKAHIAGGALPDRQLPCFKRVFDVIHGMRQLCRIAMEHPERLRIHRVGLFSRAVFDVHLIVVAYMSRIFRVLRSEEHTSELQSRGHLVCRLLLVKTSNTYPHVLTAT